MVDYWNDCFNDLHILQPDWKTIERTSDRVSSSVLEYKMTKCTSKWTTFFILTYIPNYIQNDL